MLSICLPGDLHDFLILLHKHRLLLCCFLPLLGDALGLPGLPLLRSLALSGLSGLSFLFGLMHFLPELLHHRPAVEH